MEYYEITVPRFQKVFLENNFHIKKKKKIKLNVTFEPRNDMKLNFQVENVVFKNVFAPFVIFEKRFENPELQTQSLEDSG